MMNTSKKTSDSTSNNWKRLLIEIKEELNVKNIEESGSSKLVCFRRWKILHLKDL